MSLNLKMRYKAETGNAPTVSVESELLTADTIPDEEEWLLGVFMDRFPKEYTRENGEVVLYTPEYISWLEDQLTESENTIKRLKHLEELHDVYRNMGQTIR